MSKSAAERSKTKNVEKQEKLKTYAQSLQRDWREYKRLARSTHRNKPSKLRKHVRENNTCYANKSAQEQIYEDAHSSTTPAS